MRNQLGTSLFEILISMILLAIVLLGIDAMQITSLQKAKVNYYFAVANQQVDIMIERLTLENNINEAWLTTWNKQNQEVLPQGKGIISGNYPHYEVSIFWGIWNEGSCKKNTIAQNGCVHRII